MPRVPGSAGRSGSDRGREKIVDTYTISVVMNIDRRCRKLHIAPVRVPGGRVSHGTPKGSGAEALAEIQGMASEVRRMTVRRHI